MKTKKRYVERGTCYVISRLRTTSWIASILVPPSSPAHLLRGGPFSCTKGKKGKRVVHVVDERAMGGVAGLGHTKYGTSNREVLLGGK